jgi:hypothetical protein
VLRAINAPDEERKCTILIVYLLKQCFEPENSSRIKIASFFKFSHEIVNF